MRAVLGIDAAWTAHQPSGVALLVERGRTWSCQAVAPSYQDFCDLAEGRVVDWERPTVAGSGPDPAALLRAAQVLCPSARVEVVALDLPLARGPITGRREADQAVSRAFGAKGCGTHSPSTTRPGRVSETMRSGLEAAGFRLATDPGDPRSRAILEVYPHTALLSLLGANRRIPYKASKARSYWPDATPASRRVRLLDQWRSIVAALRDRVEVALDLPRSPSSFASMKRYEDAIDSLLCAWVAVEFLARRAVPLGDPDAAIWTPSPR